MDNRCTCYLNGDWIDCCVWHDIQSADSWILRSAEDRLKADIELWQCVKAKGHPIHATIMYAGVRTWYWLKWRMIDGIKFGGDK